MVTVFFVCLFSLRNVNKASFIGPLAPLSLNCAQTVTFHSYTIWMLRREHIQTKRNGRFFGYFKTMADAMGNPENATLDHRNCNIQKNEVLFKVIELEQKMQEFDSVYVEQFEQIHSLIVKIFDQPRILLGKNESLNRTSPAAVRPEILARTIDEPDQLTTPNALPLNDILANMDSLDLSESSEDEAVIANQPQAESSRAVTPIMEEFQRKVPRLSPILHARRSQSHSSKRSTPCRAVDERRKTPDANSSSSNFSAAFVWIIIVAIVSLVVFVVGEVSGLAKIETIAKLSLDCVGKFRALMLQPLFEQSSK